MKNINIRTSMHQSLPKSSFKNSKNNCDDHEESASVKIYQTTTQHNIFRIYLGEITSDSQTDLCDILRSCDHESEVIIYINSNGGDIVQTMQIINAMKDSCATVTAVADGSVASAASLILLCAHRIVINPHSFIMCHSYSGFRAGKAHELMTSVTFINDSITDLMKECYEGFLTNVEFNDMINGKDFWFSSDESVKRIQKMIKIKDKKDKKEILSK